MATTKTTMRSQKAPLRDRNWGFDTKDRETCETQFGKCSQYSSAM
jgi:hypothetical protein